MLSSKIGMMESPDGMEQVPVPQAYQGFFVDCDDKFVILGDKVGKKLVGHYAVSIDNIEDIMLSEEGDMMSDSPPMGELN
jgi:hypothetical protein